MTRANAVTPNVVVISNANPEWPEFDKQYADEMLAMLSKGLADEGYTFRTFKFFDDLSCLDAFDPREWVVWNWGEEWAGLPWSDAEVAEEIERRGFAYTGAAPSAMRLAQNRMGMKQCLRAAGLPTLPALECRTPDDANTWTDFPAIVKGANQHASIGIDRESVVDSCEAIAKRIVHLREAYDDYALVEPFLDSREIQVAVWGNAQPEALPSSEIVFAPFTDMRDRLHTRQWKIERQSRGYLEIEMPCPAPVDRPDWRARAEQIAVDAYRVIGLRDYGRFDMRMLGDEPQILDVNPNPELDPESVVLAGAKVRGLTYGQMASRIVQLASERMPS